MLSRQCSIVRVFSRRSLLTGTTASFATAGLGTLDNTFTTFDSKKSQTTNDGCDGEVLGQDPFPYRAPEPSAAVRLFPPHVDEQTPRLVVADGALHHGRARRIGSEPCLAAPRAQAKQTVARGGRHIGFDVIDEPAKAPREGA